MPITLRPTDALLLVDVQRDFLPGGALAVPAGDDVIPILNRYIVLARDNGLPVFASRDWHPPNHCSFREQGGPWPMHCVAASEGARFADRLDLPANAMIVSKATAAAPDAYSAFSATTLATDLRSKGIERLLVGGLATDYCVLNTVRDALSAGFDVVLLTDGIRSVDLTAGDGARALTEMRERGAQLASFEDFAA